MTTKAASLRANPKSARHATVMGGGLIVMGVLHFAIPQSFDDQIPNEIPGNARTLTYASGVAEALIGGALLHPRTRRWGGAAAAALFVAVFPANLNTVRLNWDRPRARAVALARLPFQIPMITTALTIHRAGA